jgi:hypothetical protein
VRIGKNQHSQQHSAHTFYFIDLIKAAKKFNYWNRTLIWVDRRDYMEMLFYLVKKFQFDCSQKLTAA